MVLNNIERSVVRKIIFITLLFVSSLIAEETGIENILKNMTDAYGGKEKVQQLNSYTQVWDIETKTDDKNGTDYRAVLMPDSLKTELVYPDKTETRLLIKDSGIKQFDNRVIKARGPMLDAMRLQLMRLYSPLVLLEKINNIELISAKDDHYVLKLSEGTLSAEYFVPKKSYLIDKVVGTLKMGGQSMQFVTFYEDYKPINGVMVVHKEIKYAGDVNTAVMRLKKMDMVKKDEIKLF